MKEIEMSRLKLIYPMAFACIFAGVLAGCADFRQGSSDDAKITADIETRLDQMSNLGPPGSIRVQTLDHVVYLNGLVDGGFQKRTAESAAREVPGVAQVANDITVSHK
jgi:osmotically-inducible protein OsmY